MGKTRRAKTLLEVFYPELTEYQEQVKVFQWAELAINEFPELELLDGSLNGVKLSIGSAVKARKAGLKKGVPDLSLDVPRSLNLGQDSSFGGYHGLRIELKKRTNGKLTLEQIRRLDLLRANGYRAVVCYGHEQAINEIKSYLRGDYR